MPTSTTVPADPTVGGHPTTHRRRIVAALAITQTVGYGTLYYAYAVLLHPMATTLGASTTAVTGALTASVLAGALMAIPVGRWLDRHGGRALRGNALLAVTIVAGFASTIFLPLTSLLVEHLDWRTALIVLATIHGLITVPLHAATIRRPPGPPAHPGGPGRPASARAATRDVRFWIQAVAAACLPALAASRTGAVVAVVAFGLGFGVSSLAAPALLADRYGTAAYASIAGILALPVTVSRAAAPLAAAALLHAAGYQWLLIAVAICCAIAAAGMFLRAGSSPPDAANADDREAGKAGDWQRLHSLGLRPMPNAGKPPRSRDQPAEVALFPDAP